MQLPVRSCSWAPTQATLLYRYTSHVNSRCELGVRVGCEGSDVVSSTHVGRFNGKEPNTVRRRMSLRCACSSASLNVFPP